MSFRAKRGIPVPVRHVVVILIKGYANATVLRSKYNISKLVYYEVYSDPYTAISREKQIKGWRRSKKVVLIETMNPKWEDLSKEWYGEEESPRGVGHGETPLCARGDIFG